MRVPHSSLSLYVPRSSSSRLESLENEKQNNAKTRNKTMQYLTICPYLSCLVSRIIHPTSKWISPTYWLITRNLQVGLPTVAYSFTNSHINVSYLLSVRWPALGGACSSLHHAGGLCRFLPLSGAKKVDNVIALVTEVCIIYVIYGPYMYILFRNHIYIYIFEYHIYIYLGK